MKPNEGKTDLVVEFKQLLVVKLHKDIFLNLQEEKKREWFREAPKQATLEKKKKVFNGRGSKSSKERMGRSHDRLQSMGFL